MILVINTRSTGCGGTGCHQGRRPDLCDCRPPPDADESFWDQLADEPAPQEERAARMLKPAAWALAVCVVSAGVAGAIKLAFLVATP